MARKSFADPCKLTVVFFLIVAFTLITTLAASAQQASSAPDYDRPWQHFAQSGTAETQGSVIFAPLDNGSALRSPAAGKVSFRKAVPYVTTGYNPYSVAVADLNGDGNLDVVVANQSQSRNNSQGSISVMLGKGNGTFHAPVNYSSGGEGAFSISVADLNGDGKPDLVVANGCLGSNCSTGGVGVLLGKGNGTFKNAVVYASGAASVFGSRVAIGDLNGDGKLDLAVATTGSGCGSGCPKGVVGVLLGNGDGTFKKAKTYGTGGFDAIGWVAIADVNGDKKPDLVVANYCSTECSYPPVAGSVGVLLGKGNGTFQTAKTYPSGGDGAVSVAVADLNQDGKADILVANCGPEACGPGSPGGNVGVLIGKGNGTFKPVAIYPAENSPFNVAAADVNGDGMLDIVVSNWGTSNGGSNDGAVTVLRGKGNGTFRPAETFPSGGAETPSVAVADVNKDGLPDVVLACVADGLNQNSTGVVTVLINKTKIAADSFKIGEQ
jgi:FG-GAP-like repeat